MLSRQHILKLDVN